MDVFVGPVSAFFVGPVSDMLHSLTLGRCWQLISAQQTWLTLSQHQADIGTADLADI